MTNLRMVIALCVLWVTLPLRGAEIPGDIVLFQPGSVSFDSEEYALSLAGSASAGAFSFDAPTHPAKPGVIRKIGRGLGKLTKLPQRARTAGMKKKAMGGGALVTVLVVAGVVFALWAYQNEQEQKRRDQEEIDAILNQ